MPMKLPDRRTVGDIGLALGLILIASGLAINWIADHKINAWGVVALAFVLLSLVARLCGSRRDSAR
jgi:hypothetical protein